MNQRSIERETNAMDMFLLKQSVGSDEDQTRKHDRE